MLNVKKLQTKLAKALYKELDQSVTVSLSPITSSSPLSSFGYAQIDAPSGVPSTAWAEIISTNGWGTLFRMADSTTPSYRFVVPGATSGSRNITLRWHWHI